MKLKFFAQDLVHRRYSIITVECLVKCPNYTKKLRRHRTLYLPGVSYKIPKFTVDRLINLDWILPNLKSNFMKYSSGFNSYRV